MFTAQRLKAEGVMPGVADIALFIPNKDYHGLFIELKVKPNRQSTHQKEWQKVIEPQGYKYQIAYSFDEFQEIIQNYIGNP